MRIPHVLSVLLLLAAPLLPAHQVDTVEFEFLKTNTQWLLEGRMDIAYMLPETRNVPDGLPLSREATMRASPEELARIRSETEHTLRKLLRLTWADQDVAFRFEFPDFERQPFSLPEEQGDSALLTTRLIVDAKEGPGELKVHWIGENECELIILIEEGEDAVVESVAPGGSLTLWGRKTGGAAAQAERPAVWSWVLSGYRHVLPLGLDHMLFMLGLFLMLPSWKPLVGQSLLFTLAHSATLALSVLGVVQVPSRPVEVLIAFSIAFVGVENLVSRKVGRLRLTVVFCFGLIHGLGFASVLAEKLQGVSRDHLAMPLIGFNLGVELAQITVLACAFLILLPLKKQEQKLRTVGSVLVTLCGLGWMIERLLSS